MRRKKEPFMSTAGKLMYLGLFMLFVVLMAIA